MPPESFATTVSVTEPAVPLVKVGVLGIIATEATKPLSVNDIAFV